MSEIKDRITGFLRSRKLSYLKTFTPESIYAEAVLRDLAKFCRAHDSTFLPDARAHAVLEGRREVWLRIQNHLKLNTDQLYVLYGAKNGE